MIKKELGYLKVGDYFYFEGNKYQIMSLGNRPINNVNCWKCDSDGLPNFHNKLRLDLSTEVEVEGDSMTLAEIFKEKENDLIRRKDIMEHLKPIICDRENCYANQNFRCSETVCTWKLAEIEIGKDLPSVNQKPLQEELEKIKEEVKTLQKIPYGTMCGKEYLISQNCVLNILDKSISELKGDNNE